MKSHDEVVTQSYFANDLKFYLWGSLELEARLPPPGQRARVALEVPPKGFVALRVVVVAPAQEQALDAAGSRPPMWVGRGDDDGAAEQESFRLGLMVLGLMVLGGGKNYCLLELNTLCGYVTRGYGDNSPHDRRERGMAKEKCLRVVPLLCTQVRGCGVCVRSRRS